MDCLNCSAKGQYKGFAIHGSMMDHMFECECGAKWVYVTEQGLVNRVQFEFPTHKPKFIDVLLDYIDQL